MKIQKVTQLTLAALIALSAINVEAASMPTTKHHKFFQTLLTTNREALEDPYYQLKSANIRELSAEEELEFVHSEAAAESKRIKLKSLNINKDFTGPQIPKDPTTVPTPQPSVKGSSFENIIMVVDKLIAIGEKIMPAIKEGKPVVTNNPMAAISVLPRTDAKDSAVHDMGGWTIPYSKHYKITYKNGLGSEVVSFVYSISYQYNGNSDGKGKYLTGIRASARNIVVAWGFDLDASSQLIAISNLGTQQNVIAAATIEISYTVKNWTKVLTTAESFTVVGDGRLYKLD